MLDEGRRRRERGEDVVVCALQPEYPPEVQPILQKLEIIPTLKTGRIGSNRRGRGDSPASPGRADRRSCLRKSSGLPQCLSLAGRGTTARRRNFGDRHCQPAISGKTSGRSGTHHREARLLHDSERFSGSEPRTKSSSWMLRPGIAFGGSRGGERASTLAEEHKLSRLRELALLVAASVVDRQLESYLRSHGVDQLLGRAGAYSGLRHSASPTPRPCWKAGGAMPTASRANFMSFMYTSSPLSRTRSSGPETESGLCARTRGPRWKFSTVLTTQKPS